MTSDLGNIVVWMLCAFAGAVLWDLIKRAWWTLKAWWHRRSTSSLSINTGAFVAEALEPEPSEEQLLRDLQEKADARWRGDPSQPAPRGHVPWGFISEFEYQRWLRREGPGGALAELEPCVVTFFEMQRTGPVRVYRRVWRKRFPPA